MKFTLVFDPPGPRQDPLFFPKWLIVRGEQVRGFSMGPRPRCWRSDDGGRTFAVRESYVPRVGHYGVHAGADGRLYEMTEREVRWSTGAGWPRWHHLRLPREHGLGAILRTDDGALWAGGSDRHRDVHDGVLRRSSNGGRTWSRVGPDFEGGIGGLFAHAGLVYALHEERLSVCDASGVQRTWAPRLDWLQMMAVSPTGTLVIGGFRGLAYATEPLGDFTPATIEPQTEGRQAAWIEGIGFVLIAAHGLYASPDGAAWTAVPPPADFESNLFQSVAALAPGRALLGDRFGRISLLEA